MMATTARQHSLCPHTSSPSPSPSPSASLFSQPVQTSLILTSRSTPTDDVCMKVVESNTIQIVKDSTLIRLIPTATKEAPSQFPYSSSALLGPLLSKHFTFDRIYDQSDALLSPSSLTSSESQLAYANRRRLQQEELYARNIRTHLKQTIEGRGLCVIANGPRSGKIGERAQWEEAKPLWAVLSHADSFLSYTFPTGLSHSSLLLFYLTAIVKRRSRMSVIRILAVTA